MINLISHVTELKPASFSPNKTLDAFRHLDPINLPYGTACMDRRITYLYSSSGHSECIYTETKDVFFLASVDSLLTIAQNALVVMELNTLLNVASHFEHPKKRPVCTCVYVSQIHH